MAELVVAKCVCSDWYCRSVAHLGDKAQLNAVWLMRKFDIMSSNDHRIAAIFCVGRLPCTFGVNPAAILAFRHRSRQIRFKLGALRNVVNVQAVQPLSITSQKCFIHHGQDINRSLIAALLSVSWASQLPHQLALGLPNTQ